MNNVIIVFEDDYDYLSLTKLNKNIFYGSSSKCFVSFQFFTDSKSRNFSHD